MTLAFTVPGTPQGKARPRFARRGAYVATYTPDKTAAYEQEIRMAYIAEHGRAVLRGPVTALIRAYFAVPKSLSKRARAALEGKPMPHKPDADNLAKVVLDALNNGVAFSDDGCVSSLWVEKLYTFDAAEPRIEITLTGEDA